MDPLLILLLVLVFVGVSVLGFFLVRRYQQTSVRTQTPPPAEPTIDMETQERDGTAVAELPPSPQQSTGGSRFGFSPLIRNTVLALIVLLLVFGGWLLYDGLTARSPERFVLLIAPFADGSDGQTGRNVATALAQEITSQAPDRMTVVVLDQAPADTQAALDLTLREQGDLLVWGEIEAGGMLDSQSLRPRLIYTPNGPYTPNSWDGYLGRFAMPRSFTIAEQPINGRAVLVPLLLALFDYGRGYPDQAFTTLDTLLQNYAELQPALPQALRGNILWARDDLTPAVEAYRQALAAPSDEQALLANNLSAILIDAGDPGSLAALDETIRLLEGSDLGEARFNLGLLALSEQRPQDAVNDLEQVPSQQPANVPLFLALAEAYRSSGRLEESQAALDRALQQRNGDLALVPGRFHDMFSQRLDAAINTQQGLLGLARLIEARGPLIWELEIAPPQVGTQISQLREELSRAVDASNASVERWRQRSVSDEAVLQGTGQVADGQAERAERHARQQSYYLALLDGELIRSRGNTAASGLGGFFSALFGGTTPYQQAIANLNELNEINPNNPALLIATARTLRIGGDTNEADRTYDQVLQIAPQLPDGYFGKGVIALGRGDSAAATDLFNVAIERNTAFFPARVQLAQLAEDRQDWPSAIVQLRELNQQRPGPRSAVELASALRLSGPAGYPEAEQVLLQLSTSNAAAAIELARLYNDAGRSDTIAMYREALRIDPRNTTAAFELGERLAAAGDLAGAEQSFRNALDYDERNTSARLALARLYQGPLNQPDRADDEYAIAMSHGVNDFDTLMAIGNAAFINQNPNQAANAYREALKLNADSPNAHYGLAQAYYQTNRLQTANDEGQRVLSLTGDTNNPELRSLRSEALVILGDITLQQGNLTQANEYYGQAAQLNSQLIAAVVGQGRVAVGDGLWGVALNYFESAASFPGGSDSALAQFWLGEGLLRSGDFPRATAAYQRALELQPTYPEALLGLAQVQYAEQNPGAAFDTINRSLEQRPEYAEALLFKGKLLQERGEFANALSAYDASIQANGRIAESRYRRGLLLIRNEQYGKAITDLRQAVALQDNFPEAHYWLGRAYHAQGNLTSARDAFKRAVDLNIGYTEALFYFGLASEDLGERDTAITSYQSVIQANSNSEWGVRAQAQLDRMP